MASWGARPPPPRRNIMWATYVILDFLVATLKDTKINRQNQVNICVRGCWLCNGQGRWARFPASGSQEARATRSGSVGELAMLELQHPHLCCFFLIWHSYPCLGAAYRLGAHCPWLLLPRCHPCAARFCAALLTALLSPSDAPEHLALGCVITM